MQTIGIVLILLVLVLFAAWIIYTKKQSGVSGKEEKGKQVVAIEVKGGYSPSVIQAKQNTPLILRFIRKESSSCGEYVTISDFKVRKHLPENETVEIEITPTKTGEFSFTCDMGMYQGKIIVT